MHRVVRDGVEVTEQSIRFTVADPLQARLHRHAQLESRLADYDRLVRDVRSAQESVAQLQAARPETDERRCKAEAKLEALRIELEAMQHKIAPAIGTFIDDTIVEGGLYWVAHDRASGRRTDTRVRVHEPERPVCCHGTMRNEPCSRMEICSLL